MTMHPSGEHDSNAPGQGAVRAAQATGVATALRVFASIFHREPDRKLLGELDERREELLVALEMDPLAGLDLGDPGKAEEALAVDYCQLFVGPTGHLPPTESVVVGEGRYWGRATERVVACYEQMGVQVGEDAQLLPDHLAVELDCLALLEEQEQRDEATAFAHEHVLRWLPVLLRHIERRAQTKFYVVWTKGLLTLLEELYGPVPAGTQREQTFQTKE